MSANESDVDEIDVDDLVEARQSLAQQRILEEEGEEVCNTAGAPTSTTGEEEQVLRRVAATIQAQAAADDALNREEIRRVGAEELRKEACLNSEAVRRAAAEGLHKEMADTIHKQCTALLQTRNTTNPTEDDLRKIRHVTRQDMAHGMAKQQSNRCMVGAHSEAQAADVPRELSTRTASTLDDTTSTSMDHSENSRLVRARPIKADIPLDLQIAEAVTEEEEEEQRKSLSPCWACTCGSAVGVLLIFFVLLFLMFRGGGGQDNKEDHRAPIKKVDPKEDMNHYVLNLFPEYTKTRIKWDEDSAQALAFEWLLEESLQLKDYEDWRIQQRFAMATIYYATGGDNWKDNTHWLSHDRHENEWHWSSMDTFNFHFFTGVLDYAKTSMYDEVRHLWLFNNRLSGTIPPEISFLTSLITIDFVNNNLQGSLPTELCHLRNVSFFMGQLNAITGPIPSEIGMMQELKWLSLDGNQMTGTLPTELGLPRLWSLHLTSNDYTGSIPSELGQLSELVWFLLDDCTFTSTLPTELGLLTAVQIFEAQHNQLTGTIPSQLGLLVMAKQELSHYLEELEALMLPDFENVRSFNLNSMLEAAMEELQRNTIQVNSNMLTGTIPTELSQLVLGIKEECSSSLVDGTDRICNGITMDNNMLTGSLPSLPPSLMHINVAYNQLTGIIQPEFGIGALKYCDLSHNDLSGVIPPEIALWDRLEAFNVSYNNLTGSIPVSVGAMEQMEDFHIEGNPMMTGTVPTELCLLSNTSLTFNCSNALCGCDCECP